MTPLLPSHLIDRLIAMADEDVDTALAQRTDLTHTQIRTLAARSDETAVQLAYDGLLRPQDVDPAERPLAALALLDTGTGPAAWARHFAADPLVRHREGLAGCPGLPQEVVRRLADDPDVRVVAELALRAPAGLAAGLARHPHAEVRLSVAANEATPPRLLAALLTGEGLPPVGACRVCDQEEVPFVHARDCPRTDCALLSGDACDGSHQSAVHGVRWQALHNLATPTAAVARFADDPSALLRKPVAAREGLPQPVYARLAGDPVPMVRAALAQNPSIGEDLIRRLAEDDGHDVPRSLAHYPHLPLDLLARLTTATRPGSPLLPRVAAAGATELTALAGSAEPAVRMLVAMRRDLPDALRDALADDRVAEAAAANPSRRWRR
ncbi:hypothetical protein [Streptomyces sp. NPDC089915]|uniref:hypothetical protein n=1 Tax=Streptomyces sp. NPDC089915 TaxID=3155186 RepID=UPI00344912FC